MAKRLLVCVLLSAQVFAFGSLSAALSDKDSELISASMTGDIKRVEALLRKGAYIDAKGAYIDARGPNSKTPLLYAIEKDNPEVAKLLISKGANVNFTDNFGMTPLVAAAIKDQNDIVKMLLDKGANANMVQANKFPYISYKNDTALFAAVRNGNAKMVKMLVSKGADLRRKDRYGKTVLKLAEERNNAEIIKILKGAGAK